MRHVFSGGRAHLGAEQPAAFRFGIEPQDAFVALTCRGTALALELHFSHPHFIDVQRTEAAAYSCDTRICKDYRERGTAGEADGNSAGSIDSSYMSFISCLMQYRLVVIDVSSHENGHIRYL